MSISSAMEMLGSIPEKINERYADTPPSRLMAGTALGTLGSLALYNMWYEYKYGEGINGVKESGIRLAKRLPPVAAELKKKKDEAMVHLRSDYKRYSGEKVRLQLPAKGMSAEEVKQEAVDINTKLEGIDWVNGRATGAVYHGGEELSNLLTDVCKEFQWTNPLHADMFPGLKKMESEIISMTVGMYNGGANACGVLTSGGTESILMAMRAYKERAKAQHGISRPNIIVPESAHAAFDKAGNYFGIVVQRTPSCPKTGKADLDAIRRAINKNTVCLVGSAPQYGWGVIDDIEAIAKMAKSKGIGMHVDACLGGFIIPFMAEAGYPLPPFDFRVDGVTSISVDTHKYGFAPKGTSTILYNSQELRRFQYFSTPHWPGGIYATPTMAGSRPGNIVAGAWAAMVFMGKDGYINTTKKIVETTLRLKREISAIPGLHILGDPIACVVAFGATHFDPLILADKMTAKGWALSRLQFPSGIHLSVTYPHTQGTAMDEFIRDLKEGTAELMSQPRQPPSGSAAMYGSAQKYPRSIVTEITDAFFDVYYEPAFPDEKIAEDGSVSSAKK